MEKSLTSYYERKESSTPSDAFYHHVSLKLLASGLFTRQRTSVLQSCSNRHRSIRLRVPSSGRWRTKLCPVFSECCEYPLFSSSSSRISRQSVRRGNMLPYSSNSFSSWVFLPLFDLKTIAMHSSPSRSLFLSPAPRRIFGRSLVTLTFQKWVLRVL